MVAIFCHSLAMFERCSAGCQRTFSGVSRVFAIRKCSLFSTNKLTLNQKVGGSIPPRPTAGLGPYFLFLNWVGVQKDAQGEAVSIRKSE
jgi:hypothetical protein